MSMHDLLIQAVVLVVICIAVSVYGWSLAFWQRKWPRLATENYKEDVLFSALTAGFCVVCPILLIGVPFWTDFFKYGWMISRS